jgi:hypothetical protein
VAALSAAPGAAARPSAYTAVESVYARTGSIPVCRFSSAKLEAALREAPTYDVEYFGDFTAAINTALSAQATGRCSPAQAITAVRETGLHGVRVLPPPASATSGTYGSIPLPLLLGAILVGLALVVAAAAGVARLLGLDPLWAQSARHAWGEAEFRAGGTWAEFRDWLRG